MFISRIIAPILVILITRIFINPLFPSPLFAVINADALEFPL